MTTMSRKFPKSASLLLIAIAIPLGLAALLTMLEYWGIIPSSAFDAIPWQFRVALLILPGLVPISYLCWAFRWRIVAGFIYFATMFAILPLYGLVFSCAFTGRCL